MIGTAEGGYGEETREAGALGQENATATAWEDHRRKETDMRGLWCRGAQSVERAAPLRKRRLDYAPPISPQPRGLPLYARSVPGAAGRPAPP